MSEPQQISLQVATLYPRNNALRQRVDLSGFWGFRFDPEDAGLDAGWGAGFTPRRPIAVPASWNEQFEEMRDYLGPAWYQTRFALPWGWDGKRVRLRFGSANYLAEVWLNGAYLGGHEGGHLPFEFDATPPLRVEENLLVVRVEGELAPDRVPPGRIPPDPRDDFPHRNHPDTSFDFFPFCGIHRPVLLYATSYDAVSDLTVRTEIEGTTGLVRVRLDRTVGDEAAARLSLKGRGAEVAEEVRVSGETAEIELALPNAALWSPGSPNLYELTAELLRGGEVFDRYLLPGGVRTVAVEGESLLLNGEPVELRGFGRHEDFPVAGRGLVPPAVVKDYSLMRWVGANSFRTSHYPYSEETMDLADRLGFLVVDETPAVGLFFAE
ncbi:MAG: beta-galactosidase, partial [Actinomycetota bacterium]|nr:beta-galactosidase [Actinomycetota bacterium]